MKNLILIFLSMLILAICVNPAVSQASPVPDIMANGSNGPITISTNDSLSITVSLDTAGSSDNADWWVAVYTPFDWFYLNAYAGSWLQGVSFTYQGPLFNLSPVEIFNISGLPAGTYSFYFAVDINMNGQLDSDQLNYDGVVVNVIDAGSSLAGTWVATNLDSYVSLILTEPDILSDTNYTWVNKCTESGVYTVSDSSITFNMYFTNCEEGRGLVGGASDLSSQKQQKQTHKSFVYSLINKRLDIKDVRIGTQTVDLMLDLMDVSSLEKVGKGKVTVLRSRHFGPTGCCSDAWYDIDGDIPFTIYRLPGVHHYEVYGFGDLNGRYTSDCSGCKEHCNFTMEAKGIAEIRGYYSNDVCMLGLAITDNYTWGRCTITEMSGDCGGLYVGWTNPDPCMQPNPEWLEFPLMKGYVIHRAIIPDLADFILTDIEVDLDTGCVVGGL